MISDLKRLQDAFAVEKDYCDRVNELNDKISELEASLKTGQTSFEIKLEGRPPIVVNISPNPEK